MIGSSTGRSAAAYYVLTIKTFGLHAEVFHVGAMILLALGAWMSAQVIHAITGDRLMAAGTGLLYAAATPIHIDTMTWMVGLNELGAMLFMLGSMALHLRGRTGLGAAAFAVALLFKEAVLFLPILLFIHCSPGTGWRNIIRGSSPPVALRAAPRRLHDPEVLRPPLTAMPDSHPYAMRFAGFHVFGNALKYSKWYFEALLPMFAESPRGKSRRWCSPCTTARSAWPGSLRWSSPPPRGWPGTPAGRMRGPRRPTSGSCSRGFRSAFCRRCSCPIIVSGIT